MLILKILKDERRPLHFGSVPFLHTVNVWFDNAVKYIANPLNGMMNFSVQHRFMLDSEKFYSRANYFAIRNGYRNKIYVLTIRSTAV
jgi:hypothetical protein